MLQDLARHGVDFWMSSEDLPRADSRITLDRDGSVRLSLPQDNNTEGLTRMRRKFDSMLADLGFHKKSHQRGVWPGLVGQRGAHVHNKLGSHLRLVRGQGS
jgi:hypothetical protein